MGNGATTPKTLDDLLRERPGDPERQAAHKERMLIEQVGPEFYDTAGVAVALTPPGADLVSEQAVAHRRQWHTILALRTSDGRWIYPTWQFRDHDVIPGLARILTVFDEHSGWSVATWLTTPNKDLDERTPVQWLNEGRDREHLLRLARHTAYRWASHKSDTP